MAQDLNDQKTSQYHDLILFTAVVCVVTRHARLFLLRRSVALRKWSYNRRFASAIFSATQRYNIVTTLLRIVTTLFQHCNDVLRWKSSLRIVPCNITLGGYDFVCKLKNLIWLKYSCLKVLNVTRDDSQRRFLAQHSVAPLFRRVTTLFQHCNAVLR